MNQPLVILGMHRSGTSMVTRILRSQGLFTGHVLTKHAESQFFYELNEWMLGEWGASWDRPAPALRAMAQPREIERLAGVLRRRMRGPSVWGYLGPRILSGLGRIGPHLPFAWGFKDPRNSLFLPVWLHLFPDARFLRIRRHGIDVAASLVEREQRRGEVRRCRTIEEGLKLWSEYETALDTWFAEVPNDRRMTVHFEDYAADCDATQKSISAFSGLGSARDIPDELRPASDRILAYRAEPVLCAEADRFADLLRTHGYQP